MKLEKLSEQAVNELRNRSRFTSTKMMRLIEEFLALNVPVVEIKDWQGNYCEIRSAYSNINRSATRFGYRVRAFAVKDKLFICTTDSGLDKDYQK